jgi:hypothetical protein
MALTHKRRPDVIAKAAEKNAKKTEAKAALTSLAAYAAIKNPNSKDVEQAINLLAAAQSSVIRGVIGT